MVGPQRPYRLGPYRLGPYRLGPYRLGPVRVQCGPEPVLGMCRYRAGHVPVLGMSAPSRMGAEGEGGDRDGCKAEGNV